MYDDPDLDRIANRPSFADKLRRDREARSRHNQILDSQKRAHEEQLAALKAKSAREASLDGQKATLDALISEAQSRSRSLKAVYGQRWQELEASFAERLSAADQQRRDEFAGEQRLARQAMTVAAEHLQSQIDWIRDRKAQLKRAEELVQEGMDRHRRMMGLPPIEPEAERPDQAATDRQEVEQAVSDAVTELSSDESV